MGIEGDVVSCLYENAIWKSLHLLSVSLGSNIVVFHDVHLLYQTCLAFLTFTFNFFLLNFSFLGSFLLSSNCIQNRFPFHLLLNVTPLPFEFETLMIDSWFTCFSSILCSRSCLVHFSFIFIFLFQTARSLS